MRKIVLFVLVLVLATFFLSADYYIKTTVHTDPFTMMGQAQPAKDEVNEQWFSKDKLANIAGGRSVILDMGKKMMYIVNHKDKNYVETPLPLDMSKVVPAEAQSMMGMMKVTVKVAPNGQTKKIGQWNCSGYDVDMNMMMMQMKMKVWSTTEVPFDWKAFSDMYTNVSKMQFMDEASIKEFMKIKGFQISSQTTGEMMGAKLNVNSTITEISQKTAPAGIYSIPAGYTKQSTLSMQDLQGR